MCLEHESRVTVSSFLKMMPMPGILPSERLPWRPSMDIKGPLSRSLCPASHPAIFPLQLRTISAVQRCNWNMHAGVCGRAWGSKAFSRCICSCLRPVENTSKHSLDPTSCLSPRSTLHSSAALLLSHTLSRPYPWQERSAPSYIQLAPSPSPCLLALKSPPQESLPQ
jgi:hypothetical protein